MVHKQDRPETGPMAFGGDWPGVFIRGDSAMFYSQALQYPDMPMNKAIINGLKELLLSGMVRNGKDPADMQRMRSWADCAMGTMYVLFCGKFIESVTMNRRKAMSRQRKIGKKCGLLESDGVFPFFVVESGFGKFKLAPHMSDVVKHICSERIKHSNDKKYEFNTTLYCFDKEFFSKKLGTDEMGNVHHIHIDEQFFEECGASSIETVLKRFYSCPR